MYEFKNYAQENIYGGCIVSDIVNIDTELKVDTVYENSDGEIFTHSGKSLSDYNLDYWN